MNSDKAWEHGGWSDSRVHVRPTSQTVSLVNGKLQIQPLTTGYGSSGPHSIVFQFPISHFLFLLLE